MTVRGRDSVDQWIASRGVSPRITIHFPSRRRAKRGRPSRAIARIQSLPYGQRGFACEAPHDCPSDVDQKQLDDLHLIVKYPEEKK